MKSISRGNHKSAVQSQRGSQSLGSAFKRDQKVELVLRGQGFRGLDYGSIPYLQRCAVRPQGRKCPSSLPWGKKENLAPFRHPFFSFFPLFLLGMGGFRGQGRGFWPPSQ